MLFFLLVGYVTLSISLFFVFEKARVTGWKALVPGLNFIIWGSLVGRPKGYALLLLVPIVNIFILAGLAVDLVRSFDKLRYIDSLLSVVAMPFYFLYLGLNKMDQYQGAILPKEKEINNNIALARQAKNKNKYKKIISTNPYRKSWGREWIESLTFGIFAAAFIRMFLIEAYAIPTSSMEGSLLVGDRLFVSKAHYGLRMPMTIAMTPLLHNRMPIIGGKSYLEKPNLPYRRLPAIENIDVGDQIVFNWPVGDSVYMTPLRSWSARQVRDIPYAAQQTKGVPLVTHPIDKKDHYVKRCMGSPGDEIQIINREVFINGKKHSEAKGLQFKYRVTSPSGQINLKMLDRMGVSLEDSSYPANTFHLTSDQVEKIKTLDPNIRIELIPGRGGDLFPHDSKINGDWTIDNYGPITIPSAGTTVEISIENIALYKRIIDVYEDRELKIRGNEILIDGQISHTYTFKQNYYWGMGDNRHNSEDSRSWGFIPEDHIVGKPMFILFSTKNNHLREGINWNRLFSRASKYN